MTEFRAAAEAAYREGFTFFDQLGSRPVEGGLELWLRVINPRTYEARVLKTQYSTSGVSVADLWAGAKWAEAEINQDFRRAASRLTSSGESAHPGGR